MVHPTLLLSSEVSPRHPHRSYRNSSYDTSSRITAAAVSDDDDFIQNDDCHNNDNNKRNEMLIFYTQIHNNHNRQRRRCDSHHQLDQHTKSYRHDSVFLLRLSVLLLLLLQLIHQQHQQPRNQYVFVLSWTVTTSSSSRRRARIMFQQHDSQIHQSYRRPFNPLLILPLQDHHHHHHTTTVTSSSTIPLFASRKSTTLNNGDDNNSSHNFADQIPSDNNDEKKKDIDIKNNKIAKTMKTRLERQTPVAATTKALKSSSSSSKIQTKKVTKIGATKAAHSLTNRKNSKEQEEIINSTPIRRKSSFSSVSKTLKKVVVAEKASLRQVQDEVSTRSRIRSTSQNIQQLSTATTEKENNDNNNMKKMTTSKKVKTSSEIHDYMIESAMLRHNLLSMEEEQELSIAIQRARTNQKILNQILLEKNRLASKRKMMETISNYEDDDDDDDMEDDDDEDIEDNILSNEIDAYSSHIDDDNDLLTNIVKKKRKSRKYRYDTAPKTSVPKSIYESYYVGCDNNNGSPSPSLIYDRQWNIEHRDEMNILRSYDSKSRMTQIKSLQQLDDNDNDIDDDYCNINDDDDVIDTVNDEKNKVQQKWKYQSTNEIMHGMNMFDSKINDKLESKQHNDDGTTTDPLEDIILSDDEVFKYFHIDGGLIELQRILLDGALARDQLIRCNLKLVNSIAKKWSKLTAMNHPNVNGNIGLTADNKYSMYRSSWDRPSLSEAIQEGTIGLTEAVERFNPKRNFRFSTYATYWITNSIRQCYQRSTTGCMHLPTHYYEMKAKYQKTLKHYYQTTGIIPPLEQIAFDMQIPYHRLVTILEYTKPLISIDAPMFNGNNRHNAGKAGGGNMLGGTNSNDEILLSDTLVYNENVNGDITMNDNIDLSFLRQTLENAMMNELHPTERDIIRLRLGLDDNYNIHEYQHNNNNNLKASITNNMISSTKTQRKRKALSDNNNKRTMTCQEVSQYYFSGQLSSSEIRSTEQRAYKKLRSSQVLSTYQLLTYIDFADIDIETMKLR